MKTTNFVIVFSTLILGHLIVDCSTVNLKAYTAPQRALDEDEKYLLSWEIDEKKERVTFHAHVNTAGFVGLGISPNGGMEGADIFIGGVDENKPYFSDYHGVGKTEPIVDAHNDWTLSEAVEEDGWTNLTFSRLINTCDIKDFVISESATTRLIFAYGQSDEIRYHGVNRGSVSESLLETEEGDFNTSKFDSWKATINITMPSHETSYWCTIHKRDIFGGVRHVVGFDAFLEENSAAKKHTHHLVLHKCHPPKDATADETFGPFVGVDGEECYSSDATRLPKEHCTEYMFIWATGGKLTLFPDDVGYPIEEDEDESPYFMLEIHYDNPDELSNATFETGVTVYYTAALRDKEAGLMTMGYDLGPTLTVPPNTTDYVVVGHCSDYCTKTFPEEGIHIYNVLLHAHLSAMKMQLRHFRGKDELPWIFSDSSYDFNYQQNKVLKNHVHVLPGDHLITECVYDTYWNNGKVVVGGFQTTEEMCSSHIWYHPRMKQIDYCSSSYNLEQNFLDFEITNYTWSYHPIEMPIIHAPPAMQGLSYSDALSTQFNWTDAFRREYQQKRRYGNQEQVCAVLADGPEFDGHLTKYPDNFKEYIPSDVCASSSSKIPVTRYFPLFVIFLLVSPLVFHS